MARRQQEDPKAEMTPMIDVVFQLMIFFIVTIKQEDIFSKLNASAPSPNPDKSQQSDEKEQPIVIQIDTAKPEDSKTVIFGPSKIRMRYEDLDRNLRELSKTSTETAVHIMCPTESPHGNLVRVLDYCQKNKFNNLSILSQ